MKTLVVVSHPYFDRSRIIRSLSEVAQQTGRGVTVRHLEALYGSNPAQFDLAAEQAAHEAADRIVYLFPIHWFNLTPMLKAYMNEVWAYGWAFGPGGTALQGKKMLPVVSAGATSHTYSHEGLVRSTMDEVLTPLKASALYVGMEYQMPLALYESLAVDDAGLQQFKEQFESAMR